MADALARIKAAGIEVLTRQSHAKVAAMEAAIADARPLSMRINGWESRWPLNTYRNRDASKISRVMLERLAEAEAMSLDDYRTNLAQRDKVRALYAELAAECDACVGLAAPRAALACPVCFGDSNSPMAIATNMGIIAMLVVVAGMIGAFDTQLAFEFFQGFSNHAGVSLHIDNLKGHNAHHQCETIFKAFGRALRMAMTLDERSLGVVPSTKGSL